mgnify:CR=1 FL=1
MPDEALQAAFEIKAACDDISRKLLRWHWEEKPGAHSVDALLKHLAQRQKESPDYYERLPELSQTLAAQVGRILCYNKAVRHLRGGEATRRKYQSRKNESNGE